MWASQTPWRCRRERRESVWARPSCRCSIGTRRAHWRPATRPSRFAKPTTNFLSPKKKTNTLRPLIKMPQQNAYLTSRDGKRTKWRAERTKRRREALCVSRRRGRANTARWTSAICKTKDFSIKVVFFSGFWFILFTHKQLKSRTCSKTRQPMR